MKTTDRVLTAFLRAVLLRMKALGLNHTTLAARLKVARPYFKKVPTLCKLWVGENWRGRSLPIFASS